MPYFRWYGVDIAADTKKGVSYARSARELERYLFMQHISLLSCREVLRYPWRHRGIKLPALIGMWQQMALLLRAGLTIPQALNLMVTQSGNKQLAELLCAVACDVDEGSSLTKALQEYPEVFSSVMVHMVQVGEETGSLPAALSVLSDYLERMHAFRTKIRGVLLLPMITLVFFVGLALLIIGFIVPHFKTLFDSSGQPLPASTLFLMRISLLLRGNTIVLSVLLIIGGFLVINSMRRRQLLRVPDAWKLQVPWLGSLLCDASLAHFAQALSMLLGRGVSLVHALCIAQYVVGQKELRLYIVRIIEQVKEGYCLQEALRYSGGPLAQADIIALIAIGQESGELSRVMNSISMVYQAKVEKKLHVITLLIQPLCMFLLGALVLWMMVSIYMPLFSLAIIE